MPLVDEKGKIWTRFWTDDLIQKIDLYQSASASVASGTTEVQILSYTVPSGQTLYIFDWGVVVQDYATAVWGHLRRGTTYHIYGAGNPGFSQHFNKPKIVQSGETVYIFAWQLSGATRNVIAWFNGVLI